MKVAKKVKKLLHNYYQIPKRGKSLMTKVNRTSSRITKNVDHYVIKNPYRVMGVGVITGVCLGLLMHRH